MKVKTQLTSAPPRWRSFRNPPIAVVLLVGAALFIGSFVALLRIDPGFDTINVLTAQISPRITSVSDPPDHTAALAEVVDRIATLPGVEGVALLQAGRGTSDAASRATAATGSPRRRWRPILNAGFVGKNSSSTAAVRSC